MAKLIQDLRKEAIGIISLSSLGAGATSSLNDCSLVDLRDVVGCSITVKCTHNASATKALLVQLVSSPDGINFDTVDAVKDYNAFEAHLLQGQASQKTASVIDDIAYLKVKLINQDTTYAVTNIEVYAILTYNK